MTFLAGILGFLLVIAVNYILVQQLTRWLKRRGGLMIRIEVIDDSDD